MLSDRPGRYILATSRAFEGFCGWIYRRRSRCAAFSLLARSPSRNGAVMVLETLNPDRGGRFCV